MKKENKKINKINNNLLLRTHSLLNIKDPYYISGLTQADGSFFCSIEKTTQKNQSKWLSFTPIFDITVDLDSKNTLEQIKIYFSCGNVTTKISDHTAQYRVKNRNDLINIIIPHFKF